MKALKQLSYSHRVFLGAIFRPLHPQHMVIKPQWSKLDFEISKIKDEASPQDYRDDDDFDNAQRKPF